MNENWRSPEALLKASQAIALSVSDTHANILLSNPVTGRSLMKLATVCPHKESLVLANRCTDLEELNSTVLDRDASDQILRFLSSLTFRLTSESGAEYSYYSACEKPWWKTFSFVPKVKALYTMELISPASDRQIQRSLPTPDMRMIQETPALYDTIVRPHIQAMVDSGSLSWIQNVIDGTKEKERLLLNHTDFILNIDTKWRSHPNPLTTPPEQWHGHQSVQDLYCLAIVKDGSIASLRDLKQGHVPMLQAIYELGIARIEEVYGVFGDQLRIFCHYQPQFYHFHVHFTRLENEIGCQVERGHLVSDIIQNLQADNDFYAKRTIAYKLKTSSDLYKLIQDA